MFKGNLFRNQTKGLLIRTYHWQRRQRCSSFCNFILPPITIILISILSRVIKPPDTEIFEFQKRPKGAFAPIPFDPSICRHYSADLETINGICSNDRFFPKYTVPVHVPESAAAIVGQVDATNPTQNSGILSGFSLNPFIFPDALENGPDNFSRTQTPYDGVFLHALFEGDRSDKTYDEIQSSSGNGTIDEDFDVKSLPFKSRSSLLSSIYDSWFKAPFLTSFSTAMSFDSASQTSDGNLSAAVTLFYNESESFNCTEFCPIVSNVVRSYDAMYKFANPGKTAFAFLRRMPYTKEYNDLNFIQLILSILIGLLTHFPFPSFLQFLVLERVGRMRSMMAVMGLRRRQYWFGTYLGLLLQYLLTVFLVIIVGVPMNISFFAENTPVSYIILFFLWGNNLISLAMLLSPFFNSPETAQTAGWLFIILVNLIGGPYIGQRLSTDRTDEGLWSAIMLLPSFAYFRSLYYAGALNSGGKGVTVTAQTYRDNELGMCSGDGPFCRSFLFLAWEWLLFMILAAYFDRVLPSAQGTRLHPLFFLGKELGAHVEHTKVENDNRGEDVLEEEARARAIVERMESEPFHGVVLNKLSKTYPGKPPVKALRGLSLIAKKNEVLCILAHNGAGKTTAFRTLVGELSASSGEAYVCGNSILTDMDLVHRNMGVAPQQDVLWDVMTVREHLFFYGRVKNLSGSQLKQAVDESLDAVQLRFAMRRQASKLSGGMKRRLSVSIAMIGKPQFVILDEPSTGLDILAREKLWEAIERLKEDRVVMLTTHSLEEAETLSSRVAIMSHGELKCIGSAEELKLRLGKGHHLNVSLPAAAVGAFHDELMQVAPGAMIETKLGGNLEYVLPRDLPIPDVFRFMEEQRGKLEVRDWSINQATLEDVFLAVTKDEQGVYEVHR